MCKNRQLTDIQIVANAFHCGLPPKRGRDIYNRICHPQHDTDGALDIVFSCEKNDPTICSNTDDNATILQKSMQPYGKIWNNPKLLIQSVNFYCDEKG